MEDKLLGLVALNSRDELVSWYEIAGQFEEYRYMNPTVRTLQEGADKNAGFCPVVLLCPMLEDSGVLNRDVRLA